jgi:dTDP-4-amino-4,6-dideoxygalactose transaminase/carbonic anhydrase/acetyltransferase-like protein (isoleucine patch superfamily)
VIHPDATISKSAITGVGCYFGPNSLVHTTATVGDFCVVNSHSVVEHDCVIQDFVNINPGAVLCGMVIVNSYTTVGANAALRDHIEIAKHSVIGMQAGVVSSIHVEKQIHTGVPCGMMAKEKGQRTNNSPEASCNVGSRPQDGKSTKVRNDSGPFCLSDSDHLKWISKKKFNLERFGTYLEPSLKKGHLTNDGPLQRVVSAKIQEVCGSSRRVIMSASGTAALHTLGSAWAIKLGRHLKFATQSFTFPSSIQGPFSNSHILDMDAKLHGPCMKKLNEIVNDIDGVVVTNIFGHLSNCLAYESWCLKHDKILLLDNAATPFGECLDGRCVHDVGHGAFVSLHETKPIGRGEGGAIFLPSDLPIYVHRAMNFGFNVLCNERVGHRFASNWRMSDFAAAAICDHLDQIVESDWKRKSESLAKFAIGEMEKYPFKLHQGLNFPNLCPCLWINVGETECDLDIVATYLQRCLPRIEAKRYYRPLGSREEHPIAWEIFDKSICLPLNVDMSKEMVAYELDQLNYAITFLFG